MRKATGHFFSRFQNEGVWPRRDAFCHAVAGIVDASELAHLRQRVTEKREVLLLAQLTNQTNLIQRFFVVLTANQRKTGVGRNSSQLPFCQELRGLFDAMRLRALRHHLQYVSHYFDLFYI